MLDVEKMTLRELEEFGKCASPGLPCCETPGCSGECVDSEQSREWLQD